MKSRLAKRLLVLLALLALVGTVIQTIAFHSPSRREFYLHQTRYERILHKVQSAGLAPGQRKVFWVHASSLDPDTFGRESGGRSTMMGKISAQRNEAGDYQFSLITDDQGHEGAYGYIYSDSALQNHNVGDFVGAKERLNVHWWIGYNDLYSTGCRPVLKRSEPTSRKLPFINFCPLFQPPDHLV